MSPNAADFPYLTGLKKRPVKASWIWSAPNPGAHLTRMEAALCTIQNAGFTEADLDEPLRTALDPASDETWLSGYQELLGLAHLVENDMLLRVGWNGSGSAGGSAAFDAEIRSTWGASGGMLRFLLGGHHPPASLVVDFKPASKSGREIVRSAFKPLADAWARAVGLGSVTIDIGFTGTVARETVGGGNTRPLAAAFTTALETGDQRLPKSVPIPLANGTKIDVRVRSHHRLASDHGFVMLQDKAISVYDLLRRQVEKKDKHRTNLDCPPFLLMYIAPYGHPGADIDEHTLSLATRNLDQDLAKSKAPEGERWLGVVFLSQTLLEKCFVYIRPYVARRFLISRCRLATKLGAELWPLKMKTGPRPVRIKRRS